MTAIIRKHRSARMSQIVLHRDTVWLSGQVLPDFLEGCPPVAEQTRKILSRIDELLAEAGTSKSRLLFAQILLADVGDFEEMNGVWEAWIDPRDPPARTTCGATLTHPNIRVEITVGAALSEER